MIGSNKINPHMLCISSINRFLVLVRMGALVQNQVLVFKRASFVLADHLS